MRISDTWAMIPFVMVVIVLLNIYGRTVGNFILFFTIFGWVGRARVLRAAALSQRQMDYVNASKTLGTPNMTIIVREMLPNLIDVTVANFVLTIAANIGIETGLSLLGFGLGWNFPSLGVMMQNAVNPMYLQHFPWVWAPALVLVCVMMLCVNFVGNALQRVADPKQRFA
jgi:peptide/nickel transport system permease protein